MGAVTRATLHRHTDHSLRYVNELSNNISLSNPSQHFSQPNKNPDFHRGFMIKTDRLIFCRLLQLLLYFGEVGREFSRMFHQL